MHKHGNEDDPSADLIQKARDTAKIAVKPVTIDYGERWN